METNKRSEQPSRSFSGSSRPNYSAIERLADLAAQNGEKERVTMLRRRKADIEKAPIDYKQLVNHPELVPLGGRARAGRPKRSAGGTTRDSLVARSRHGEIPPSSTRPQPRRHGWRRPSRHRGCRGRSPTAGAVSFSGQTNTVVVADAT